MTEEEIFLAAIERPPEERCALLDEACDADVDLRDRVEALIAAHESADSLLDIPVDAADAATDAWAAESIGSKIGPYKLRELIGEGGFGLVYVAEQELPIRRKVALKVIKPGMDSKEVIARFEAERQALALMDHPNIATVHDAGTTDAGRPYFVMELVRGLPITDYCDQAKLSLRERLQLFTTVCQAVQHAHQKGIIHRDLKPSNVMITLHDGTPVPKVIDFGVAKALSQKLTEHTLYTRHAQMLGTPMYMSPEQAELSGSEIDTRSDVYSLGVLLYELLTGQTPFEKDALSNLGYDDLRRMVREVEPPRPSIRLSTLVADDRSTLAKRCGIDERQHLRELRGELDWIVMTALEKDRTRRYGSADGLAADVRRHLDDQPVQACPPSWGYRLRKLAWRKRGLLATVALLAICVPITAIGTYALIQSHRSRQSSSDGPTPKPPTDSADVLASSVPSSSSLASTQDLSLPGLIPEPTPIPGIRRWQIICRRGRHKTGPIYWGHFAWSPSARYIARPDRSLLRVYEVPGFELSRVLSCRVSNLTKVAWSPDGGRIASGTENGIVSVWDVDRGSALLELVGHTSSVRSVAWHPDGETLVSGDSEGQLRFWSTDGLTRQSLSAHGQRWINDLAWSPDGTLLASAGDDGTIALWEADGTQRLEFDTGNEGLWTVSWSPDGASLLTAHGATGVVRIWGLDGTPGSAFSGHTDYLKRAVWSPAGTHVATVANDGKLRIWDVETKDLRIVDVDQGPMGWLAWHPANGSIVTYSTGGFQIWQPLTGEEIGALREQYDVRSVKLSPDGQKLAANIGVGNEFHMLLCDADGSHPLFLDDHTAYPLDFCWTPDGALAVGGGGAPPLRLIRPDGSAGPIVIAQSDFAQEGEAGCVRRFSISPDGHQFAAALEDSSMPSGRRWLQIWNRDGSPGPVLTGAEGSRGVRPTWSPRGDMVAAYSGDSSLSIWNSNGEPLTSVITRGEETFAIWKRDGTQIAGVNPYLGVTEIWDLNGRQVAALTGDQLGQPPYDWAMLEHDQFSNGYSTEHRCAIRHHHPQTSRVDWILAVIQNAELIKFTPDGHLVSGDVHVVDQEFVYLIEQKTGAIDIMKPSEFRNRHLSD